MEDELALLKQNYEKDLSKMLCEEKESMSAKTWTNYVEKMFVDVKKNYIEIMEHVEKFQKEYVEEPEEEPEDEQAE